MVKKLVVVFFLIPGIIITTLAFPVAADSGLNFCTDVNGGCRAKPPANCKPGDWNCTPWLSCDCDPDPTNTFCMCWQYAVIEP